MAFSVEPKLAFPTGPAAAISAGPEQSPRRFENQSKTTWADMKEETGFYLKSSLCFPEKSGSVRVWVPLLREKGGGIYGKPLCFFGPPSAKKPGISWFFDAASSLHNLFGSGSRSQTDKPSLAADFE